MSKPNESYFYSRKCFLLRPGARRKSSYFAMAATLALIIIFTGNYSQADEPDPLAGINKPVHEFNSLVDAWIFRPLAIAYKNLVPKFMQEGVRNFLSNLDDVSVTANDLLQGNVDQAGRDFSRLLINSTLGIGGLIDVADMAFALEKHDEDFGQTLAHWGVDRGPYLVLPFLGPSTVREGFAGITNLYFNPGFNTSDSSKRNRFIGLSGISARADLLQFEDLIIGDEYLFNRGVYLQHLNFREGKEESYIEFSEFE